MLPKDYNIYILCYNQFAVNSNGIITYYEYARLLNEAGFNAKIIPIDCFANTNVITVHEQFLLSIPEVYRRYVFTKSHTTEEFNKITNDNDIIFCSEILTQRHLFKHKYFFRVISSYPGYLVKMHRNGLLGFNLGHNDYVVGYGVSIPDIKDIELPEAHIITDRRSIFKSKHLKNKENLILVYYGKNFEMTQTEYEDILKKFNDAKQLFCNSETKVIEITREYPQQSELFDLLSRAKLLISFDPLTSTTYEATLLGTPVLMMHDVFGLVSKYPNHRAHQGLFTDLNEYDNAFLKAQKALDIYCDYIDNHQVDALRNVMNKAILHFEKFDSDSSYAEIYTQRNKLMESYYLPRDEKHNVVGNSVSIENYYSQFLSKSENNQCQVNVKYDDIIKKINKLLPYNSIQREFVKSGYYLAKALYRVVKVIYNKIMNNNGK